MASAMKTTASSTGAAKTPKSKSKMVTFKITADMRPALDARFPPASPSPPPSVKSEPAASATPQPIPTINSPAQNLSPSSGATPVPNGTSDALAMPPPTEAPAKKGKGGPKRKAVEIGADGLPKPRGKPGPKKRKLEDGTTDGTITKAAPKRGPKANEGAINAGLRALDRSGAPCRKWSKGSFTLKTFTGAIWEIPRWKAPPKIKVNSQTEGSTTGSSGKENKANSNSQVDSEPSNVGLPAADASSIGIPPSSPAPQQAPPAAPFASSVVSASA